MSATGFLISLSGTPETRSGSATLSKAERCETSRKSWNTTPMRRRNAGRRPRGTVITSVPNIRMIPREGRWAIVLRQPIYEKDRLDPVAPDATLALDKTLLQRFPEGYRHLAYLQSRIGYAVKRDMPGLKGAEVEALYARGRRWLQGGALDA